MKVLLLFATLTALVVGNCTQYSTQLDCSEITITTEFPACGPFASAYDVKAKNATVFASIGDFGLVSECQSLVSQLLHNLEDQFGISLAEQFPSWSLSSNTSGFAWLLSMGDNAYWGGSCNDFSTSMTPLYGSWTGDFSASSCSTTIPATNESMSSFQSLLSTHSTRLLPCLGNHDWDAQVSLGMQMPYFKYFPYLQHLQSQFSRNALNTRQSSHSFVSSDQFIESSIDADDPWYGAHYDTMLGDRVYLVVLNSNLKNVSTPDYQTQINWAKSTITNAKQSFSTWQHQPFVILLFHHPSYCSAQHDPLASWMQYDWGAIGVDGLRLSLEISPSSHFWFLSLFQSF